MTKITYGIASVGHMTGGSPEDMHKDDLLTYDEAYEYIHNCFKDCNPTVYLIYDNKYAFDCERYAVEDAPYAYMIYRTDVIDGGYITTKIMIDNFIKNPEKYIHLAAGVKTDGVWTNK